MLRVALGDPERLCSFRFGDTAVRVPIGFAVASQYTDLLGKAGTTSRSGPWRFRRSIFEQAYFSRLFAVPWLRSTELFRQTVFLPQLGHDLIDAGLILFSICRLQRRHGRCTPTVESIFVDREQHIADTEASGDYVLKLFERFYAASPSIPRHLDAIGPNRRVKRPDAPRLATARRVPRDQGRFELYQKKLTSVPISRD